MSWLKLQKLEGVMSQRLEGLWDVGLLSGVGLLDGGTPQSSDRGRGWTRCSAMLSSPSYNSGFRVLAQCSDSSAVNY